MDEDAKAPFKLKSAQRVKEFEEEFKVWQEKQPAEEADDDDEDDAPPPPPPPPMNIYIGKVHTYDHPTMETFPSTLTSLSLSLCLSTYLAATNHTTEGGIGDPEGN